ncbi:uncharacterized protein LOC110833989 isoform X2 [Zootermopsis nevadensis]|nr:uncharacterized protein LOC110833989 isoform X2 [Zootermopsis nevadensis]
MAKSDVRVKGNVSYDKQVTARFHTGRCCSKNVVGEMPKAKEVSSACRGSHGIQREMKTRGTISSVCSKAPQRIEHVVEEELCEKQENIMEDYSGIDDLLDRVTDLTSEYVVPMEEDITIMESENNEQEARLWNELWATQALQNATNDRINEVKERSDSLCTFIRILWDEVLDLEALLKDTKRKNSWLRHIIRQQQLMMEQADCVMCQQRKLSKGHEEAKPDKQADQVNKEVSVQADKMKELYSAIDRMDFQVMNLNKEIEQMQQQKIKFQARSAYREAHIAQLVRDLREK